MGKEHKSVEQLLDECAGFDLRRTARRVTNLYDQIIEPSGITAAQWPLLRALEHGALSMSRLSIELQVDRTSLRRMLDPLEKHNLVAVSPDPLDKRSRLVSLTEQGDLARKSAYTHWRRAQETLFHILGEDQWRDLVSVLRKTNRAVREATSDDRDEQPGS
ncbi:MarR family winged helix-turn-helix transcriptional regulator (plasmid) [Agrobacterium fabrum]|uniref:MarR family winged helix-turn-helix transcriptional regulator n=1 Tax=Agrobacterium fabrum TaxID=1176649 RepID=UPI00157470F6|nr:MarR family transcriptional regulator [Agrobacterium fabrum]NTB10501.1 MarR family transcriptional regulator [Agrobacterium fabrum]